MYTDQEGPASERVWRPGHVLEDDRLHASSFFRRERLKLGDELVAGHVTYGRPDQMNGRQPALSLRTIAEPFFRDETDGTVDRRPHGHVAVAPA